jgi:hypothetical protein
MTTNTQPSNIDEYIKLYTRIFVFDKDATPDKSTDIDLSKLNVPSIYTNVSVQDVIQRNGLNIGDGYSYLDFKKDKLTGVITFYRRNPNNKLLSMEYIPSDKTLYAIVNGTRHKISAIIDELQQVLDQM